MFRSLLVPRPDAAPLLARLVLGVVMFPHGAQHALGWFGGYGFHGTLGWMTGTLGIPAWLAAPAIIVELVAPVALVLGLGTRFAAIGIAALMAGAALTHASNGFFMNWFGGLPAGAEGYEYHLLAGALAVVVALAGSGAWSLDRRLTRAYAPLALIAVAACGDANTGPSDPVPVASITLDRSSATLREGEQTRLTATPRDAAGNPLSGRFVTWSSSDATVAAVTAAGLVTALRPQTATITAAAEGKTAAATIAVVSEYAYELIHSGWPDYPFGGWRVFRTRLSDGVTEPVVPADVLPTFGFGRAAVSRDGSRIALVGYDQNAADVSYIFVGNADGSGLRQLTTGGVETQPTWSPDGTRIAYLVRARGQPGDIWVINADGTDPVNITAGMGNTRQYSPAWSAELPGGGSRIVFAEGDAMHSNLWTMRPDGSDRHRVTTGTEWWDDDPEWSPDGSRIVFMRDGPGTEGGYDIWVVDATGANAQSVVKLPDGQTYPTWSPDGRLIAFNSSHGDNPFTIYTVWSDGSNVVPRTLEPWWSTQPAWGLRP